MSSSTPKLSHIARAWSVELASLSDRDRARFGLGLIALAFTGAWLGYALGSRYPSLMFAWMLGGVVLGALANVAINGRVLVSRVKERAKSYASLNEWLEEGAP